jgi:zinc transport system substrate-binding protein
MDPAHAAAYQERGDAYLLRLNALKRRLDTLLAPCNGQVVMVYHPAFGYLMDAYGMRQLPIELDGKEPSAKHLAATIRQARALNVKAIGIQPQFNPAPAKRLAKELGATVKTFNPLPKNYLEDMETLAANLRAACLGPEAGEGD